MRYGTGWHWSPLGDGRSALVPMSTQYETPPLRWRHPETCPVDRVSGLGCTCTLNLNDWHPDCGGDWVLSGPNYFANYWPDNTVIASILDGPDGNELVTSGIQPFANKAQCMAYAEWWIRAELTAMKTDETRGQTMASKPKSYKAPYDRDGNLMHYPKTQRWRDEETGQRHQAAPEWRTPEPMRATLLYEGYARGRSAVYFLWRHSVTGTQYPMFLVDFDDMMKTRTVPLQGVHATWIEGKIGEHYGIRIATAAEIEAQQRTEDD